MPHGKQSRKTGKISLFRKRDKERAAELLAFHEQLCAKDKSTGLNKEDADKTALPISLNTVDQVDSEINLIKEAGKHAVLVIGGEGKQDSLFFRDRNIRDNLYARLTKAGFVSKNFRGVTLTPREYHPAESDLFEIPITSALADTITNNPEIFHPVRVANWAVSVEPDMKVIEALRAFRRVWVPTRDMPDEHRGLKYTTALRHEPPTLLTEKEINATIKYQGVIALIDETKGSLFFTDEKIRDQVFRSLEALAPTNLAINRLRQIKRPRDHKTPTGDIFEIKIARSYAKQLLLEMKEERVINQGFDIRKYDKVEEVLKQFARISVMAQPEEQDTYVPGRFDHIQAKVQPEGKDEYVPGRFDHIRPRTNENVAVPILAAVAARDSETSDIHTEGEPMLHTTNGAAHAATNGVAASSGSFSPQEDSSVGYAGYTQYLESFGFKLKEHRENHKMSRDQVAEAVGKHLGPVADKITGEHVKRWEQTRDVPNEAQFNALSVILIDDNAKITDKAKAREELKAAYTRSLAVKQGTSSNDDDRYVFADKLAELKEESLSRDKLASLIEDKLKNPLPKEEGELLAQHKGKFIAGIEAGVIKPSKSLMLALVKALDEHKPLEGQQKAELYEAYERVPNRTMELPKSARAANETPAAVSNGSANGAAQNGAAGHAAFALASIGGKGPDNRRHSPRGPRNWLQEEPDDPILKLKFKLRQIVNKDGNTQTAISHATGIPQPTLSALLSAANLDPRKAGGYSENTHRRLVDYIRKVHGKEADAKVVEFEALYAQLKTAYQNKGTDRTV
jgi:transcriptional regulator with XRE-family HTH domain